MTRISREAMFLQIVRTIEQRSSCERGHVAALIVRDARIVSIGYNGAPKGMPDCYEVGCEVLECTCIPETDGSHKAYCPANLGCQRTIHAELNAIVWAARAGIQINGGVMYCTYSPCRSCAHAIVASGLIALHYVKPYREGRGDILRDAGLEVIDHGGLYS